MHRKIKQVISKLDDYGARQIIVAVCEDGTLWSRELHYDKETKVNYYKWTLIPGPPIAEQTKEEHDATATEV